METRASVDIDALRRFLVSVGSDTPDLIFYPGKTEAIYHYTDLNAMQNIIDKHDLWLTNCLYSNDYGELTYGYAIAREAIDEEKAQAKEQARTDYLEGVSNLLTTPPPEGVYICCFCEEDNLLSQW